VKEATVALGEKGLAVGLNDFGVKGLALEFNFSSALLGPADGT
jgi:hypothetical protein